jgi:hypothetical protein
MKLSCGRGLVGEESKTLFRNEMLRVMTILFILLKLRFFFFLK